MIDVMTRWEPNARGRLEQAALELYAERGFERTTVADIATRAGLTERTFFRHFADKREVLFAGAEELQELLVGTAAGARRPRTPIEAVAAALEAVSGWFRDRRERARRRQAVIAANAELQERELVKLASVAAGARRARCATAASRSRPRADRRGGDRRLPRPRSSAGSPTTRSGSWPRSSASRSTRCAP